MSIRTGGWTLGFLLSAVAVRALEPYDVLFFSKGPVTLRPHVSLNETYNDNIFYRSQTPVTDFITTISPGARVQLGRDDHNFIALDYTLSQSFYLDHSELNSMEHSIALDTRVDRVRWQLDGLDRIQFLSSPIGGSDRVSDEAASGETFSLADRKVDRMSFFDNYRFSYFISPKTSAYVGGNYRATDYEEGVRLYDQDDITGTLGAGYHPSGKIAFFSEVYYGRSLRESNSSTLGAAPDAEFLGGFVGARGEFTPKLSGLAKVGYQTLWFEDETSAPDAPVVQVSLSHQFSPKTSASLSYSRSSSSSVQSARQAYISDSFGVNVTQAIGTAGKFGVDAGGNYQINEYSDSGAGSAREDTYWRAHIGMVYNIQPWVRATARYSYQTYDSSLAGQVDYQVNTVTVGLSVGY